MVLSKVTKYGSKKGLYLRTSVPAEVVDRYEIKEGDSFVWRFIGGHTEISVIDCNGVTKDVR